MIESEQKISLSRAQRCILIISHLVISVTAYILPRIISGEQISTIGTVEVLMAWILGWQQGIWTWSYSESLLSVLARIPYSQRIPELNLRDPRQGLEHGFQASASRKGSKVDVVRNPCWQPLLGSIMISFGLDPLHLTHPWLNTGDPKQGQQHRIQAIVTFIVLFVFSHWHNL